MLISLMLTACAPQGSDPLPDTETVSTDADGDGYRVDVDCNDEDAAVSPAGLEVCDGVDNDCDGAVDEEVSSTWYEDNDGDGFGDPDAPTERCGAGADVVLTGTDCNDANADAFPGNTEVCDDADNDCDEVADEGLVSAWFVDADGDGHGDPGKAGFACAAPEGWVASYDDCDDSDPDVYEGAEEVCDSVDNDCDGGADEDDVCLYDLGDADARIAGSAEYQTLGTGVAVLPDLDGNGVGELAIGGPDNSGDTRGALYLFNHLPSAAGDSTDADATITSPAGEAGLLGYAVASSADLTGDGIADLVSGSSGNSVYVFAGPAFASGSVADAAASIDSDYDGAIGEGVGSSGDVDGDSIADLAMGGEGSGGSYLFLGPFDGTYDATDAAARYDGHYVMTGAVVGDLDGDGLGDVVFSDYGEGVALVYCDVKSGTLDASNATAILARTSSDGVPGIRIPRVGDDNGDGYGDLLLADSMDNTGEAYAGGAFLFHGPVTGERSAATAEAHMYGIVASERVGHYAAAGEDVDGDGANDVILGATSRAGGGGAYLLYGPFLGTIEVQTAARTFAAERDGGHAGWDVALGDLDLDGLADVIIGAAYLSEAYELQGAAYVVYGAGL